jgi:hypothetical protein
MAPGWISREQSQSWDFGINGESTFSGVVDTLADNGIAVIIAGYRGRGTVNDTPAQGMVYRDAWSNGSYISPIFYAIDVLNLLSGLKTLANVQWQQWLLPAEPAPRFDFDKVSLWGHSQGGDVGLTALAVVGHNPRFKQRVYTASLWAGNIPDRFTQADTFGPMATTTQAFLSGDGTWTGSARGRNGEINPDFVFAWPSDWIGTVDPQSPQWTWQAEQWSVGSVAQSRRDKYREMYSALNRYVKDLQDVDFAEEKDAAGHTVFLHDPRVAEMMPQLGGYFFDHYIEAPLALHISDRDYYSFPAWNHDLARRINATGGQARVYIYRGNTHSLRHSKHDWFSPEGTVDGAPLATERDRQLFIDGALAP